MALAVALVHGGAALALGQAAASTAPPTRPDPAAHYLFYLHGKIVEDQGRRPTHPRFGVYELDGVLAALAVDGAVVVAPQRPAGARVAEHAAAVVAELERLLAAGVPESHLAVVGFSKGGQIAQQVSARLARPGVRYVLLAACPGPGEGQARLHGKVLSLREASDTVPSCAALFERSRGSAETREQVLSLGGGHGAFYRPAPAWVDAVRAFVR